MNFAYTLPSKRSAPDETNLRTSALARACNALIQWPDGLFKLTKPVDCPQHRWEWVRRHYVLLDTFGKYSAIARSTRGLWSVTAPSRKASSRRISTRAAAHLGNVDENALKSAWDEGKFTQHFSSYNAVRVRAFDPVEVIAIAPLLRIVKARANAALLLGLPIYGVEQLLACGILLPGKPRLGVNQRTVHLDAACALIGVLTDNSQRDLDDSLSFTEAIRHVSGRPKPWGTAIRGMLTGKIGFKIRIGDEEEKWSLVRRLVVPADSIPVLVALAKEIPKEADLERADSWSQEDALECLNGNRSVPAPLNGLVPVGLSPKLYRVTDILDLATIGVTTSDLARRSGRNAMRTAMMLNQNSVPQIAPGLWERERAEQVALDPHIRT